MISITKFTLILMVIPTIVLAQSGPGRQGMRFDPEKMANAEKQLLNDSISGLNADQKLIIDEIYRDFSAASSKAMDRVDPDNRDATREIMMSIRKEKNEALQAILTSQQFSKFQELLDKRNEQASNRRRRND